MNKFKTRKVMVVVVYTTRGICKFPLSYLKEGLCARDREVFARAEKILLRYDEVDAFLVE